MSYEWKCTVGGSFKFKPKLDRAIHLFQDAGFKVLSPRKGGLFYPTSNQLWLPDSYPLAYERNMSESDARKYHEDAVEYGADFNYFVVERGYIGKDVRREIWKAIEANFDRLAGLYASEPIDPAFIGHYGGIFEIKTPEEVIDIWSKLNPHANKLWLSRHPIADEYRKAHQIWLWN